MKNPTSMYARYLHWRPVCALSLSLLVATGLMVTGGCGSGSHSATASTNNTSVVTIAINPLQVTLNTGSTQQFTVTVGNTTNQRATWSIEEGATGGSITSAGFYTAPAAAGTYHVVATSAADSSKTAVAIIIVQAVPTTTAATVNIVPSSVALGINTSETFTATVTNETDQSVTWGVEEGATGGTITSAGVYTAPSTTGTYHVVATSVADTSITSTATVTVHAGSSVVTVN